MKNPTKIILNLVIGSIVSVISYIGFKKGVEVLEKKMEENPPQPSQSKR
ncbi:hypothetical protein ACFLYJ_01210 [Candidatus Cloacimonadota bacterium]